MRRAIGIAGCLLFVWPGMAPSLGMAAEPAPPAGRALLISDIHLDPLADPAILDKLIASPVARWKAIFQSSQKKALSAYGADTNYPLFASVLTEIAAQGPFDYVVFTGDALRHSFAEKFEAATGSSNGFAEFAAKTEVFVIDELQRTTKSPVIAALGNNDTSCGDYQIALESPFLAAVADQSNVLDKSPEAKATFRVGGFFSVAHPAFPDRDMVVLNTVLWSTSYKSCTPDSGDPGEAELDWLGWKLYAARLQHRGVTLVMHVPPGMNAFESAKGGQCANAAPFWDDRYAKRFSALMQEYSAIVQLGFAGHTHMDDFRVSTAGTPSLPMRITPAVSPMFNNNPAISVMSYSPQTGVVSDIATFFLALSSQKPEWSKEYQFSAAYGVSSFDAAGLTKVAASIRGSADARANFEKYYAVSTPSPLNDSNWPFYSCAQTEFTAESYSSCVCGAVSQGEKK